MAYESKQRKPMDDDTIVLFKNDQAKSAQDPTYKGYGKSGGVDMWASAWINVSKSGDKYMKIKLKAKQEQRRESYDRSQAPFDDRNPPPQGDSEIPF